MIEQVIKGLDKGLDAFVSKYTLEDDIMTELRQLLLNSLQESVASVQTAGSTTTGVRRTRRKTGYNLYIKACFAKAAEEAAESGDAEDADKKKANSQDQMSVYSKQWAQLSDADKEPYNKEATALNNANGVDTTKKTKGKKKKMSGYNLYYRNNKDTIRSGLKEGEKLMTVVGASWRALSSEEQDSYNALALAEAEKEAEKEA